MIATIQADLSWVVRLVREKIIATTIEKYAGKGTGFNRIVSDEYIVDLFFEEIWFFLV